MDRKQTFLFKAAAMNAFSELSFYVITDPLKLYNELEGKKKSKKNPRVHHASLVTTY